MEPKLKEKSTESWLAASGLRLSEWFERWFPDAFAGTMSQLLIAIEKGTEPAISGRDNLKTMALVDAAYLSAAEHRAITIKEIEQKKS